jgi:hypothetical protein
MTNEERMRRALNCIGNNLRGPGLDFRPISYEFAVKIADLAFTVAEGRPHPEFDAACAQLERGEISG